MSARYTVGIDLGTSHTVVAYADHAALASASDDAIRLFPIRQAVGPGEVAASELLPSVRYHPAPGELGAGGVHTAPPSPATEVPAVLGEYARALGAQVPGRLVSSAKSWLSHPGVDRTAAILPWGAPEDVPKVSPVTASASYLAHVRAAWDAAFPDATLAEQDIVLTVPASFDEGARSLTLAAAEQAGLNLNHLRLLEEPQAAFHDWLFRHRTHLNEALGKARLVLVCDVGGGTTDLTLIQVAHNAQGLPQLTRIGVGDHLMLGGDNMDLALAHLVERRMAQRTPLSAARLAQLVQRCRIAKEQLLSDPAPQEVTVTLLGGGAQLIGGASSVTLQRDEVLQLIVDGFMPREAATTHPRQRRAGIVEFGLPYPADPAITRHLAAFLNRHAQASRQALGSAPNAAVPGTVPVPDTLLLNGGVFRAPVLAQRLADTLGDWAGHAVQVLHNDAPDVAVARGAVAYALVRSERVPELGRGIGGGSARSYLLVLDDTPGQRQGICVLPRGTPEDTEVVLPDRTFALRLGQAVRFHLVSSVADTAWQAGELIDLDDERFVRLPPITTVLPLPGGQRALDVQVRLSATMTEVGTLEVHCTRIDDPHQRWRLAFELRGTPSPDSADTVPTDAPTHPRLPQAVQLIDQVFGPLAQAVNAKTVRQLRTRLEQCLGARDTWDLPLLRALFDALWARMRRRRRSAEHERVWLNLTGYCLRPGLGAPLDAWRIEQVWPLFEQGIQYTQDSNNWSEWWTLWRRAAGGLDSAQQLQLLEVVGEHLMSIQHARRDKDPLQNSYDDMVRLVASLERVPAAYRVEVGNWLVQRLQKTGDKPHTWWAVGRLGARISLYGNAENVVPPDTASVWLNALLGLDWRTVDHAAFAATTLARMSGDRARDLPAELRETVIQRLEALRAPTSWSAMVRAVVELDEADQKRSFGEALPAGLRLITA